MYKNVFKKCIKMYKKCVKIMYQKMCKKKLENTILFLCGSKIEKKN